MNKILACPNCGPKQNQTQLRCERCGRELAFVDWVGVVASGAGGESRPLTGVRPADRDADGDDARHAGTVLARPGITLVLAALVIVLVGSAVYLRPWRHPVETRPEGGRPGVSDVAARPGLPWIIPDSGSRAAAEPPVDGAHQHGDLARVLERYRAALAQRPADAPLLDNVGQILVAMNRPAEAVPYLKQAVDIEPFNVTARFDLAVAYARCGQLEDAVAEYDALARAGTADPRVYHNMGLALRKLGRNAEAVAVFARATALAPDQSASWLGLALSLEGDTRGSEAAAALERVLTLEPERADADSIRARIARLRAVATLSPPTPPEGGSQASRQGQ